MRHLIVRAVRGALRVVLPTRGKHRATPSEPTPAVVVSQRIAPWAERENPYAGPLVRPYVDHAAWRAELDAMQREFEEREQQRVRREALRAVVMGQPDPGYTFPGAHTLAGAVA